MPRLQELLRAAGIGVERDDERSALRDELSHLAGFTRERRLRTIGLAPAGDDVAVPLVAVRYGRALSEMSARPVGIVDALGTWTCARDLVYAAAAPEGSGPLVTSWLLDNLAVLTPRAPEHVSVVDRLRSLVAHDAVGFNHLLVDLTGIEQLGEQQAACALLEAVVVVARSGRTTTSQIPRWFRDLPLGRGLGVLLTGL